MPSLKDGCQPLHILIDEEIVFEFQLVFASLAVIYVQLLIYE